MQAKAIRADAARRLARLAVQGEHTQRASLANLRRGIGKAPGELPVLWGEFLQDLSEELQSTDEQPSRAEWAIYLTLTMYALHQQGHTLPQDNMNREGVSLGAAVRRLVKDGEKPEDNSVLKRFNRLLTASGMPEAANHLRGIVQLLRRDGIPLDYPQLAEELYLLQIPEKAPRVRLHWGRDYYRNQNENTQENKGE